MILRLLRIRRNVNRNVFNGRKTVSATAHWLELRSDVEAGGGGGQLGNCLIVMALWLNDRLSVATQSFDVD